MKEKKINPHIHLSHFNPDVTSLNRAHQDFNVELGKFNAGNNSLSFNEFIRNEAEEYCKDGNGVTSVVWNVFYDQENKESGREIVSFYTLGVTAIPYEDRIREEDSDTNNVYYNCEIWSIPALEIKMFAVDEKYQDVFFTIDDEDLPIAAWILRSIVHYSHSLINNTVGFKALFLHAVPEAVDFYCKNDFHFMEMNMQPLHCIDSDYIPMYMALKNIIMNYDE